MQLFYLNLLTSSELAFPVKPKMPFLDVDRIEREFRSVSDPNEAITCLLRILETPIVSQCIENNPSACNELAAKLRKRPTAPAMTPAPTPPNADLLGSGCPLPNFQCTAIMDEDPTDFSSPLFTESRDDNTNSAIFSLFPSREHSQTDPAVAHSPTHDENLPSPLRQGAPKRKRNFENTKPSKRVNHELSDDVQVPPLDVIMQGRATALIPEGLMRGPYPDPQDTKGGPEPPTDFGEERFARLPSSLRAKVQNIETGDELQHAWRFCCCLREQNYLNSSGTLVHLPQTDLLHAIKPAESREKQLRHYIENWDILLEKLSASKEFCHVGRRVHLVELAARYENDKVNDRFIDELFPETVAKPGRKQTPNEKEARNKKKRVFEYWIRLGKRLLDVVKRFGVGVILTHTRHINDRQLNRLRVEQVPHLLDYIDRCHPGLKEQLSTLSVILPDAINYGLPSQLLKIETIPYEKLSEFRDLPLEEMFQFSDLAVNVSHSGVPFPVDDDVLFSQMIGPSFMSDESQLNQFTRIS